MAGNFGGGSGGLSGGTTRDADGRVRYADGSVGPAVAGWNDGGNWTYAQNADVQGDIYRAQGMTPPGQGSGLLSGDNMKSPYQVGGDNTKSPYQQPAMPTASAAGNISSYTAGQNPYLQQQGDQMAQQMTQNLQRNVLPRIGSQAMASGGYGGSRQGVVESNAMSDMNSSLASGLTNLYSNGYNQNLQYDLGRRGNDLGYYSATNQNNQAMGNLGLGYAGLDRQINNDNLAWQQQGYNNNMGLWNQQMTNNQTGINAGTQIQNTPMNYLNQFGNLYNSIGQGYGNTTTSGGGGNPVMGALGGAQLGSQVANWWNGGSANSAGGSNSQGFGTGSGYGNQDMGQYF